MFDFDVSTFIAGVDDVHSAVFDSPAALALVERILRGVDRKHLVEEKSAA